MSERFLGHERLEFDSGQKQTLRNIGEKALRISERDYCSGHPLFRGGRIMKLGYNNRLHNEMVGDDAVRVGAKVGFSSSEQDLLRATGRAHDVVQRNLIMGRPRGLDEKESAEWMEAEIIKANLFDSAVAKLAGKAILATEPRFDSAGHLRGKVVGQKGDVFSYDSKWEEKFVKSVTSADFGNIYTPMGPYFGYLLFAQRQGVEPGKVPSMKDFPNFADKQEEFFSGFKFPLKEAEKVLTSHKRQVIKFSRFVNKEVKKGNLHDWGTVIDLSKRFMKTPNMNLKDVV